MRPSPNATRLSSQRLRRLSGGFTLVELLIGMLIAMIGVIIMMEVLLSSEERTRTTTGGNDALSNGAVMLHVLQRDLLQAGYGLNAMKLLGCSVVLPTGATVALSPMVINPATTLVPAGDANTDRILVFYGNDNGQPEGNTIYTVTGNDYSVQSPTAFAVGDYVIAAPDTCTAALTLAKVTAVDTSKVTVDTVLPSGTVLYNMGKAPRVVAYAVRGGSLTSCDFMSVDCRTNNATNWAAVSANIPSLRAVYGRDTTAGSMDGIVDSYDQTTPTDACGWARVASARVAIVARSAQYESQIDAGTGQRACQQVTTAAPAWQGTSAAPIVLSGLADWQCYRYRTFESVAPVRNVIWMGVQPGC